MVSGFEPVKIRPLKNKFSGCILENSKISGKKEIPLFSSIKYSINIMLVYINLIMF